MTMFLFSLVVAAACPDTKVINLTKEWNSIDERSLKFAKSRCAEIYDDSPCLKVFEKREENLYRATCGGRE